MDQKRFFPVVKSCFWHGPKMVLSRSQRLFSTPVVKGSSGDPIICLIAIFRNFRNWYLCWLISKGEKCREWFARWFRLTEPVCLRSSFWLHFWSNSHHFFQQPIRMRKIIFVTEFLGGGPQAKASDFSDLRLYWNIF